MTHSGSRTTDSDAIPAPSQSPVRANAASATESPARAASVIEAPVRPSIVQSSRDKRSFAADGFSEISSLA